MTAILIMALCLVSACLIALFVRYSQIVKKTGKLNIVLDELKIAQDTLANTNTSRLKAIDEMVSVSTATDNLRKIQNDVKAEIKVAEANKEAAIKLAEKELELEREKHLSEFKRKLEEEKTNLLAASDFTKYKQELNDINNQIESARQTLKVQQEQALNAAKEEDFVNFHSIGLTPQDTKDIELIRDFAPKLTRQEAFFKLIWSEFYQKPIQALCKILDAEKVTGIYKITNTTNGRMYIGQAVDIATRWKEHCKSGLGIGSTGYLTNKFYKALHDTGIENFTFEVLEICLKEELNDKEFFWIDFHNATTFGYNSKAGG